MSKEIVQGPCPKCGKVHTQGPYEPRPDGKAVQPRDIKCDCGLVLHWSVPIFKITESGYVLRLLKDDEVAFLPEDTEIGSRLAKELIGLTMTQAREHCEAHGFKIRYRSIDDKPCIITADIRQDRIECRSVGDKIVEASVG